MQCELGCVQGHVLGAVMLGCVLSARLTNRSVTAIYSYQEHDIVLNNSTEFVLNDLILMCGQFGFLVSFNDKQLYHELKLNIVVMRVAKHVLHDMQQLTIELHTSNDKESLK